MIYENEKKQDTLDSLEEIYFDEPQELSPQRPLSGKLAGLISHEYFYDKYIKSDMASLEFDKAVDTLRTNPEALAYLLELNNATQYTFENSLLGLVDQYTTETNPTLLAVIMSSLKLHSKVKSIEYSNKCLVITLTDNTVIHAQNLCQTLGMDNSKEESPVARLSNAPKMSLELARHLPNAIVVTGKVAGQTSKSSYLHTWVETTTEDGRQVVLDYSMNAIINKQGYYTLRHASQISAINGADIASDMEKVSPFINAGELSGKEYLVYRDSIMEILKENEQ